MTQIQLRTAWWMVLAAFLVGVAAASSITCKLVGARGLPSNNFPAAAPVSMPNASGAPMLGPPKPIYVQGKTIYRDTGRVDTATEYQVITEHTIDTLMLPYATGVEHDTTFLTNKYDILAAFQPRGHFVELVVGAEHDLIAGGYGGQARLQLNLSKAHIANLTPFAEVGYLHGLHGTLGVEGVVWGIW